MITGYKLRIQIADHLSKRADAIGTAVTNLNKAAAALSPPRPPVPIKDILSYSFLAEFDILRDARQDIRKKPWSHPGMRVVIEKYYRHIRAKEELIRLNVEIQRLQTWIHDDEGSMQRVLSDLRQSDQPLACELATRLRSKQLVNVKIMKQLTKIEAMKGFTGVPGRGVGRCTVPSATISAPTPNSSPATMTNINAGIVRLTNEDDDEEDDEDEDRHHEMDGINAVSKRMVG